MKREEMRKSTDRRVFKSTADKIKTINVKPLMMRGGIRL